MNPRTTRLLEHLDHHRANLRTAVDEIPPELRSRRPAPERWSVIELLEHLMLVERRLTYLFNQWLAEAREQGLPPEEETNTGSAVNLEVVLNRNYLVTASEAVRPQGKLDEAAAWAALEEARQDLKATVLSAEGLPMGRFSRPHPALGPQFLPVGRVRGLARGAAYGADPRERGGVGGISRAVERLRNGFPAQCYHSSGALVEGVLERFPLLSIDLATARIHAQLWATLASAGLLIGPHDLWLAATALSNDLTLATGNLREFKRVPGLVVESWEE